MAGSFPIPARTTIVPDAMAKNSCPVGHQRQPPPPPPAMSPDSDTQPRYRLPQGCPLQFLATDISFSSNKSRKHSSISFNSLIFL